MRKRSELAMEKRCGKPWLLLWLLPYLMLSLFSGTSHNHGSASHQVSSHHALSLSGASSALSAASRAGGSDSRAALQVALQVSAAGERASAYSECLACHWASSAIALLATSGPSPAPPLLAVPLPRTIISLSREARGGRSIRGPPLS